MRNKIEDRNSTACVKKKIAQKAVRNSGAGACEQRKYIGIRNKEVIQFQTI